jgi:hypothetical protein
MTVFPLRDYPATGLIAVNGVSGAMPGRMVPEHLSLDGMMGFGVYQPLIEQPP